MNVDTQPETRWRIRLARPGPALVARVLGGVLCIAAALKVVNLFLPHADEIGMTFPLIGSAVELFVGAALLLRIQPSVSVPAGGLLFLLLGGASLIGAVRGTASCGCLGMVPMPPWLMLVLDGAAAMALLWGPLTSGGLRSKRALVIGAAGLATFLGGLGVGTILYPPRAKAATTPEEVAAAKVVVIDPALLAGRPFLLLPYIRTDVHLSRGDWKVIFVNPDCHLCERRLRGSLCKPTGDEGVAVVLVKDQAGLDPPPGVQGRDRDSSARRRPGPSTCR